MKNETKIENNIVKNTGLLGQPLKYYRTLVDCEDPDENASIENASIEAANNTIK